MSREHMNNVILAGPLSKFKVYQGDSYGNTKVGFLVGARDDNLPVRVSAKFKHDWMTKQGQEGRSVLITKGYMNGWEKDGKFNFNVGARASGIYFMNNMIDSFCEATVEGMIVAVSGQWVTLHSTYIIPNPKSGPPNRERIVVARFPVDQDPRAVGNLALIVGQPNPKLNDKWYMHLDVSRGWILWGKK